MIWTLLKRGLCFLLIAMMVACSKDDAEPTVEEEKEDSGAPVFQADPTVFYHEGVYYLYGTNDVDPNRGFQVYTSSDLKSWHGPKGVHSGYALIKEDVYGDHGFWAPQVWHENNKFYMAYTANENIAIAQSESPLGPFIQIDKTNIQTSAKIIDPFVFTDDDGKKYLYHVRLSNGNRIFVAEMTDDYTAIDASTLKECVVATGGWEKTAGASVAEGPTVFKHNDLYYMVYSANDFRNQHYAVGYATSHSVYGPWEKYEGNPILSVHNTNWPGVGHGDVMWDKENNPYYVFHGHYARSQVTPRRTALVKLMFEKDDDSGIDKLVVDEETFAFMGAK